MKRMESDWYRKIWTLDIQNQSWVEDTRRQVDFLVDKLELKGGDPAAMLALGEQLCRDYGLRPEPKSKFYRASRL